ncbi:MAG TPA: sulfurtransferase, partial [Candidatus Marinimicrobia bacterium]|nr:sulfurtransferase [Candidatus Neomarinimicrobiota bacterium]
MKEITTSELYEHMSRGALVIDVRPVDAYNGWRLQGEERGGHIFGAKSLPFKWTNYMDWIEIVQQKQIFPENEIIVYGYKSEESRKVAALFEKAGFKNVSIYQHFLTEWNPGKIHPMENLARYRHLVPAEWVKKLISGESVPEITNEKYTVVQAHYRNRDAYLSGHIPGAVDMDTLALEAPETWNRRSPEELKIALEKHGITSDTTVVLYGKFMHPDYTDPFPGSAAGHIGAIRCAFIMMYAGVKDVRILNGGFQSWIDAGYPVSTDDVPLKPVPDFGTVIPANPHLVVDTPEAKKMLTAGDADLVCVRSYPEYIGDVSGYHYIKAKGRIPGAVFADCGSDAYHMENYRNVDHTTREYHEIREIWDKSGITPDKHLAFYCGTGWR